MKLISCKYTRNLSVSQIFVQAFSKIVGKSVGIVGLQGVYKIAHNGLGYRQLAE